MPSANSSEARSIGHKYAPRGAAEYGCDLETRRESLAVPGVGRQFGSGAEEGDSRPDGGGGYGSAYEPRGVEENSINMSQKLGPAGDPRWQRFLELTAGHPPWEMLVRAAREAVPGGRALDLGSGAGRDTIYLAQQGFQVVAVDAQSAAGRYVDGLPGVRFVCSRFEDVDFRPREFDLINAHFSLPFVGRARYGEVFGRVRAALAPRGVITGQFFGLHDSWNVPDRDIAFHSQTEAEGLLSGLDVLEWREEDQDGQTADGSAKHWHLFHFIARME